MEKLKAPFTYFGGKASVAHKIWDALGNVEHYLEPFFGSGAVLLSRPHVFNPNKNTETVNDIDGFVCNAWRSIQFEPEETAKWCDWPVNHADLMARKKRLIKKEQYLLKNLIKDPEWCDPKLGGYWIWTAACCIGTWSSPNAIPNLGAKGRSLVSPANNLNPYDWFSELSKRLRHVRVVCGEWHRICGGDWQDNAWKTVGIYFDPPYGEENPRSSPYNKDSFTVSKDVREWAIERGSRKNYRIVISGYGNEHKELEDHGWRVYKWKAHGGYGHKSKTKNGIGKSNAKLERLWVSPNCVEQTEKIQKIF